MPVMVKLYCDECNKEMERAPGTDILMSMPPQYRYICNNCGKTVLSTENYPRIEYEYRHYPRIEHEYR